MLRKRKTFINFFFANIQPSYLVPSFAFIFQINFSLTNTIFRIFFIQSLLCIYHNKLFIDNFSQKNRNSPKLPPLSVPEKLLQFYCLLLTELELLLSGSH